MGTNVNEGLESLSNSGKGAKDMCHLGNSKPKEGFDQARLVNNYFLRLETQTIGVPLAE